MIQLHQFAPAWGLPNASPFCMKLETWLRMAGLAYTAIDSNVAVMRAPKRKLPYIVDDDGTRVADSSLIVEHLKARHGDLLDGSLSPRQRAAALALQRLMEENLYWAIVHTRWAEEAGWRQTRVAFFGMLPPPARAVVSRLARRGVLAQMHGHGMGRHTPEQVHAIGCRDVTALADWLGEQSYFMGEAPTSVDATAYAFLANVLWAPVESPIRRCAAASPTLQAYCERMKARYYGDA